MGINRRGRIKLWRRARRSASPSGRITKFLIRNWLIGMCKFAFLIEPGDIEEKGPGLKSIFVDLMTP